MDTKKIIDQIIEQLANTEYLSDVTNQYSFEKDTNEIRRNNLREYLTTMLDLKPEILLVSEAPGYLGMCRTGVPFVSEVILTMNKLFKTSAIYKVDTYTKPKAEQSATIVWGVLDTLNKLPIMWPTFPFHPHNPNDKNSNRKPILKEIEIGKQFLKIIIDLYRPSKILAVGRVAENTLSEMKIKNSYIRHPANGGATLFREGLISLI